MPFVNASPNDAQKSTYQHAAAKRTPVTMVSNEDGTGPSRERWISTKAARNGIKIKSHQMKCGVFGAAATNRQTFMTVWRRELIILAFQAVPALPKDGYSFDRIAKIGLAASLRS